MPRSAVKSIFGATMEYKNAEMKVLELANAFRDGTISLIPPFQRGRVWSKPTRRKLIENMVRGRPIPAIFLYKDTVSEDSSTFTYNILDGKQRLESLLLFIAEGRPDLSVPTWESYFYKSHPDANFKINVAPAGEKVKLQSLAEIDASLIRKFREYRVPTIEIDLDQEDGSLDEVIDLFIDINSYGAKVTRFDVIKTMTSRKHPNPLLSDTFKLIAFKRLTKKDYLIKPNTSIYATIIKRLKVVESQDGRERKVNKVWERFLELVLFVRTGQHRTLAQILKAFMGGKLDSSRITKPEMQGLKGLFNTLNSVFAQSGMKTSQLATNQTHFYTLATSIHSLDLKETYGLDELKRKLKDLSGMIDGDIKAPRGSTARLEEYMELSSKQTTHPGRRQARQDLFEKLLEAI